MSLSTAAGGERFDLAYLVLSGTTTAARCPELLRALIALGFATVIAIPTPNASRVIAPRDLADVEGVQVVESYFDLAIRPRPPRGVVLFAPCSFNSLNKLAHGIADNLALSVVAEAIGRATPVIVGPSLNAPLLDHPEAQASLKRLPTWGVTIIPPVDEGEGPRLAPTDCWSMPFAPMSVEADASHRWAKGLPAGRRCTNMFSVRYVRRSRCAHNSGDRDGIPSYW